MIRKQSAFTKPPPSGETDAETEPTWQKDSEIWYQYRDTQTSRDYYVNTSNGQTTWSKPDTSDGSIIINYNSQHTINTGIVAVLAPLS